MIITILDDELSAEMINLALVSEPALAQDWEWAEEVEAWSRYHHCNAVSLLWGSKLRPAVVLANAGRGDWVLCQITSNPYNDPDAIRFTQTDLQQGSLNSVSFARPMKLFTANESLRA